MIARKESNNILSFRDYLASTGLDQTVLEELCNISRELSFDNDDLYDPKKGGVAFFYIKSGFVVEEDTFCDGSVFNNFLYGEGSILFNPMMFSDSYHNVVAEYRTFFNAELVVVHLDSLKELAKKYPELIAYVQKGYAEQSMIERKGSMLLMMIDKKEILICSLLNLSFFWGEKSISLSVSRLARLLNFSRQYVITVLNELIDEGYLVKDKGGLSIPDPSTIIHLLPDCVIETMRTMPKCEVFNIYGCIFGKCAEHL